MLSYVENNEILAWCMILEIDDIISFRKASSVKVVEIALSLLDINKKSITGVSFLGTENAAHSVIDNIGNCLYGFCQQF